MILSRCFPPFVGSVPAFWRRSKTIVPFALGLMLTCCANKPPERAAMEALVACLHTAAGRLDDGVSDAMTVALTLKTPCAAEFAQSRDVYARKMSPAAAQIFHREDNVVFARLATDVVLNERAKGRVPLGRGNPVGVYLKTRRVSACRAAHISHRRGGSMTTTHASS